jgi:3-hydroxymyristoyl/3-hydroxydecanoyl-(acyl carrier protein) dehydratase
MIMDGWHAVAPVGEASPDGLTAVFQVPPDAPWFSGHFPEEPILPGVAMLSMAAGMVRRLEAKRHGTVRLAGLKRVRFRMPVKPDDVLTIALHHEKTGVATGYAFEVRVRGNIACTGVLVFEQAGAG